MTTTAGTPLAKLAQRSIVGTAAALALALGLGGPAWGDDSLVLGKKLIVKDPTDSEQNRTVIVLGKESPSDVILPTDVVPVSASLRVILNGASGSDATYPLGAPGQWSAAGGLLKYTRGDPVKLVLLRPTGNGTFVLKAKLKGSAGPASLDSVPPNPGSDGGIILTFDQGSGPQTFAVAFGGAAGGTSVVNGPQLWKLTNATVQPGPPVPSGPCNCGPATPSTLTLTTSVGSGSCGRALTTSGGTFRSIDCGGFYWGGGVFGHEIPIRMPDQTVAIATVLACSASALTLGGRSAAETGSNRTCTTAGCLFGPPTPAPLPSAPPVSLCVIYKVAQSVAGTANCSTGAADLSLPLTADLYLTGDSLPSVAGIQPCPLCVAGACMGGPNDGLSCTPAGTNLGDAGPTSHDCPPDPYFLMNPVPTMQLALTTGTVTWTATPATNDDETVANQARVFSGYCRDSEETLCFKGDQRPECPPSPPGAQLCWQNGTAVGAACSGVFETCEQRDHGAFGPNGGAVQTITAIGTAAGNLGDNAPHAVTLASLFAVGPTFDTFDGFMDALLDLPGPGAVALEGTIQVQ